MNEDPALSLKDLPPLVLTMGEPAGVGGELTLKAWASRKEGDLAFFVIDDPGRLAALAKTLNLDVRIQVIDRPSIAANVFPHALPVLPEQVRQSVTHGRPDPANAQAVVASIERAAALALAGNVAAVITNPIQKSVLHEAGFGFPGHTEFLLDLAGGEKAGYHVEMMLVATGLRVVPVTIHMALSAAIAALTPDMIVESARITDTALKFDFAIDEPRLAVAGLNPHASEGGRFGDEEERIVIPAVQILREEGINARGPWVPDTMFHEFARSQYDAAICLYHDQGLIPLKTLDFHGGVNVTLGLPIVRTSPDHGTALDIAGTGKARCDSLIAALGLATKIAVNRQRTAA